MMQEDTTSIHMCSHAKRLAIAFFSQPHKTTLSIRFYTTLIRLVRPIRLQHLRDITGHRSLHQCSFLLGTNRLTQLLTGIFP